jgi:hypothetical protein
MSELSKEQIEQWLKADVGLEDFRKRYADLCSYRDAIEVEIAPLRAALAAEQVNAEKARVRCQEVADQLMAARGGAKWFKLKKEIGLLAKALGGK